jgi:hypothetical protein
MILVALLTSVFSIANAEPIEGVVRLVGSGANATTVISDPKGVELVTLCKGKPAEQLAAIAGMTVAADVAGNQVAANCRQLTSFSVIKTGSGRPAFVGTLKETKEGFALDSDDGQSRPLQTVPKGLRKLIGKKVIVDLRSMSSPALKNESWKVVSYAPFPGSKD